MAVGEVMMVKKLAEVSGSDASTPPPELHVLAVDDSFVDRKVIEKLLRISACKVTVVESGTRALQYLGLDGENNAANLKDLKVNLIMTDYSMPGITGYELLKKIKESSAFKEIPVVIMSSENILPRIERCLEEGAEDFLLKPVKLSDVKRLTETIMRGDAEECETEDPERNIEHEIVPSSPPLQSHEILPLNESAPNSWIKAEPVALS